MNSIREWLEQQGLAEFAGVFDEERVEFETLPDLTETDLKDLGLPLGSRKKLLRAIRELEGDSPAPMPFAAVPATAPSSSVETREAERRQLTVMFADLVGSTELSQRLDPEDLREINLAYQDAAKIAIESFGGFVARYMGDGVLAYFGYPLAHEDDAERAVRSGLDIILAVQRLDTAVALAARVGVATGPVVVGDIIGEGASQESAVVGETPNLASRLQGLADPNELVISEQTRRLTRGAFLYGDLGEHVLKGFAEPVQAWQVRGESISESRFEALSGETLGAFVGREHDLGTLGQRWRQALGGEGQAVLVSGEAGIGKSRVTDALRGGLAEADYVWIRHQCTPHHTNSALYPFISQLERASGATAGDADELRLQKLRALLAQANPEIDDEAVCLIAALLSISTIGRYPPLELSAQEQKTKTFEVLIDQFMRLAHERPMLWVFEDAQWADPTTRELLDHMIEQMHDLRALAVITARPEYQPDWIGLGHSSSLTLGRLSRTQSHALIVDITSGKTLPDAVLEQIVGKTDGVPLFVEELTKAVLESALLTEHSDHYELSGPFQSVSIPGTLQDSLMARLDRLGEAKQVAQTAAAIGREFQRDLLSRVMSQEAASLERSLGDLVAAGMLFRRGVAPADRYVFKHALVQEAALDSMLRRIRQAVHKRIAQVLEAEFTGVRDSAPEVLAHHFAEAGEDELAVVYWQQAGRRSAQRSANVEAVAHLSRALQILATLPESPARNEQELALQTALGPVQMAVEGFASKAVEQAYTRARELCEITGQSDSLFQTLYGLFRLCLIRAQYGQAGDLAKALLAHTECANDRIHRLTAHRASGNAILWAGEVAKAQEHLAQGISLYDRESDRGLALVYGDDPGVDCLGYSAMAQWWLGYADQARELRRQSLDLARELNHPFTLARALALSGLLDCLMRNFDGLAPEADELLALATQHNMSNWQGIAQMYLGIEQASDQNAAADGALFDRGYANFRATGAILLTRLTPGFLADVLLRAGDTTSGSAMLTLAFDSEDKMGFLDVELLRLRGDHELMKNNADVGIEAFYQQALSLSREHGARALELRTATSLARLWSQRSKRPQANELLSPLYGWFTEGFDAPDLIEARQLLDELS